MRIKHFSILTVGGRALLKHCHRSSDGFWGNNTGSEKEKNKRAEEVAKKILCEAVWINVHKVLQSEIIVECRVA